MGGWQPFGPVREITRAEGNILYELDGRSALGTAVSIDSAAGTRLRRRVRTDGSYASGNDPRVAFGLGASMRIEAVDIEWLGGGRTEWRDLPVGRYLVGHDRREAAP